MGDPYQMGGMGIGGGRNRRGGGPDRQRMRNEGYAAGRPRRNAGRGLRDDVDQIFPGIRRGNHRPRDFQDGRDAMNDASARLEASLAASMNEIEEWYDRYGCPDPDDYYSSSDTDSSDSDSSYGDGFLRPHRTFTAGRENPPLRIRGGADPDDGEYDNEDAIFSDNERPRRRGGARRPARRGNPRPGLQRGRGGDGDDDYERPRRGGGGARRTGRRGNPPPGIRGGIGSEDDLDEDEDDFAPMPRRPPRAAAASPGAGPNRRGMFDVETPEGSVVSGDDPAPLAGDDEPPSEEEDPAPAPPPRRRPYGQQPFDIDDDDGDDFPPPPPLGRREARRPRQAPAPPLAPLGNPRRVRGRRRPPPPASDDDFDLSASDEDADLGAPRAHFHHGGPRGPHHERVFTQHGDDASGVGRAMGLVPWMGGRQVHVVQRGRGGRAGRRGFQSRPHRGRGRGGGGGGLWGLIGL